MTMTRIMTVTTGTGMTRGAAMTKGTAIGTCESNLPRGAHTGAVFDIGDIGWRRHNVPPTRVLLRLAPRSPVLPSSLVTPKADILPL
jgi:hypothetical protein